RRHKRRRLAMSVSDDFTKLKEQVEKADRTIRAALARDDAELKATIDEVRKKADERESQLHATSAEAGDKDESHWNEVKRDWDQHIQRVRKHIDAKKADVDASVAAHDAESAEADAIDAMQFAGSAIEEAQYAVLEALRAERRAQIAGAAM